VALLLVAAIPTQAQNSDIHFDPAITHEEFETFSRLVAQGIYATPVEPARAQGLLGFDIGVAATAVPVDPQATYWLKSVDDDFSMGDHVALPKLVVSKGLSFGTIAASYAKIPDSEIQVWGASYDIPITRGSITTPALTLRAAYSQVRGVEVLDLSTYGAEVFLSKGFGPITPYAAAGIARHNSEGRIDLPAGNTVTLSDESNMKRYTLGVRISFFLPKLVIEATQGEERSYAAKISFGL
jgi:hypothetical protein